MYAVQTEHDGRRIPAAGVEYVIRTSSSGKGAEFDYGTGLALAWTARPSPSEPGMLVIEADVLVDPDDMECMAQAIAEQPGDVIAAPYVCWPESTKLAHPMTLPRFNHGVHVFGLGCTWLPAKLIDVVWPKLATHHWIGLDVTFSEAAMDLGLTVRMPFGTSVKHAHF